MGMRECLVTVLAAMQDPTTGLAPRTEALAAEMGYAAGYIRSDFTYEKWMLSGNMREAGTTNIALRPFAQAVNQKPFAATGLRDSRIGIEVAAEFFASDTDVLQDNAVVVSMAMMQVLDGIESFSRANGGTIEMLEDPVQLTFGDFAGDVTTSGFNARFYVLERSTR